jgi:hypothetical protein
MKYNLLGAVSTIALGAALGLGVGTPASAAVQTITDSWSFGPSLGGNTVLSFGGYTGVPADLTSIVVTYTVNQDILRGTDALVSGTSGTATSLQANSSVGIKLPEPFGLTLAAVTLSTQPPYTNPAVTNGLATYASATLSPVPVIEVQTFTGGAMTALEAALNITLHASNSQGGSVSSNVLTGVSGTMSGTLQLSYFYTVPEPPPPPPSPTPEPASLALLGAGLAGLGAIRRRRKI